MTLGRTLSSPSTWYSRWFSLAFETRLSVSSIAVQERIIGALYQSQIVAAVPAEGRLEATDRTRWFGFRDDVVVRVTAEGTGTRVDVRSVSRVGRSDLGTNARRIRRFLEAVQAASDRPSGSSSPKG